MTEIFYSADRMERTLLQAGCGSLPIKGGSRFGKEKLVWINWVRTDRGICRQLGLRREVLVGESGQRDG